MSSPEISPPSLLESLSFWGTGKDVSSKSGEYSEWVVTAMLSDGIVAPWMNFTKTDYCMLNSIAVNHIIFINCLLLQSLMSD
jgi:hypothetical protein